MAHLAQRTLDLVQQGDTVGAGAYLERQIRFLRAHLLNWVPTFCADIERLADSDFYRGLAVLTRDHLASEQETLPALAQALRPFQQDAAVLGE